MRRAALRGRDRCRVLWGAVMGDFKSIPHAFPFTIPASGADGAVTVFGMTLRDWFAGLAMQGICANTTYLDCNRGYSIRQVASDAYAIADAMLSERSK